MNTIPELHIETMRLTRSGFYRITFYDYNDRPIYQVVDRRYYHETMFDFLYRQLFCNWLPVTGVLPKLEYLTVKHYDTDRAYLHNNYFQYYTYDLKKVFVTA